jgi:hypothetical protein
VIQYISYWSRGRVLWKFWGIVPITVKLAAQDAKTIYESDKDSLLYLTDGDEVVLHKGHMGMGGDCVSVISEGKTGVGVRYKENNPRVMMNHCACHKSSLSAADGAAGVPELAVFDHQVKSFYKFFGHSVDRRTMHSHVQQRMQETVRHLKSSIVCTVHQNFASQSHHKYKIIIFFPGDVNYEANFSFLFLLHKRAKPIHPPYLPSHPPARTQNPPIRPYLEPFSLRPSLRSPIPQPTLLPFCLPGDDG